MSTFPHRKSDYAQKLIKEFSELVEEYDNRAHNYIVSSLVTAVLMYHLSWVQTVAPPEEEKASVVYINKDGFACAEKLVQNLGCRHGNYDPLWAQLRFGFMLWVVYIFVIKLLC